MIKNSHKSILRTFMKDELKKISIVDKNKFSSIIVHKVITHPVFVSSSLILIYYPLLSEVNTRAIIEAAFSLHKQVALPRIVEDELEFHLISDGYDKELSKSVFGSMEPQEGAPFIKIDDYSDILLIVPAVAFSVTKERLGRSKGFYDRFIKRNRESLFILGLCFDIQLLDTIIVDSWDEKVDCVITERRVIE